MIYKKREIRKSSWRRRKVGEVSLVRDRIACSRIKRLILKCVGQFRTHAILDDDCNTRIKERIRKVVRKLVTMRNEISFIKYDILNNPLPVINRKYLTIDQLDDDIISEYFRFKSKSDIHRLFNGFQFQMQYSYGSHKYSGHEVLLVGLYRLHSPNTTGDYVYRNMFGLYYQRVSECFLLFLKHMCEHWSYLLFDNMNYWKDKIPTFAEVIRKKLLQQSECYFPPNDFCIFGFIDNTMNRTCRPGGGPASDGVNAPRNDPELQRAWYNGWKKLHGLKYQTIDLPNGMNFNVYGPVSVRHNDLYTLYKSDIDTKLSNLMHDFDNKYCVYGDSAYAIFLLQCIRSRHGNVINNPRLILENKALSSARQVIEWDYGDVSKFWSMIAFNKVLKMRRMPVAHMYITAMILRNALNCMYGSITASYFDCLPPTFENWVAGI